MHLARIVQDLFVMILEYMHFSFQYLFMSSVREAMTLWNSGKLGKPLHFNLKYYHGDYLRKEYRDKRSSRLTLAPDGGAMVDLGSHAISLITVEMSDYKVAIFQAENEH